MKNSLLLLLALLPVLMKAQTSARWHQQNETPPYDSVIAYYKQLASGSAMCALTESGGTDSGRPLHVFTIGKNDDEKKIRILIMNGIHPGEPEGINACMIMAEELLQNEKKLSVITGKAVISIIPVYNVDGALNRGCCSRANQNGPNEYGFRGNGRNLDLNRDFIKCDSENAKSFVRLFQEFDPDIFVDTHTSNGADYQYVMTLISTQYDKLGGELGEFLRNQMEPALYREMKQRKVLMSPYVNTAGETPESGIYSFNETPRYSTGYAALFSTIGFVTETHMWKPFADRVRATTSFLEVLINYAIANGETIKGKRSKHKESMQMAKTFHLNFQPDTTRRDSILFSGYEAKYRESAVTGHKQLYYDRKAPFNKHVPYFTHYKSSLILEAPATYVIPQAWKEVLERLEMNSVKMERLEKDTTLTVEASYILKYETVKSPYEGHYLHSGVQVKKEEQKVHFLKGDFVISTSQPSKRFIVESLEPQAVDSYFAWNFFDSVLQQKEWFSDYIFDETAADLLKSDAALKADFEKKKSSDAEFAANKWNQLYFIYQHSPYYETSHNRLPVFRIK